MPSLFGRMNPSKHASGANELANTRPQPEHGSETWAEVVRPEIQVGAWILPTIPLTEALFQSGPGEPYLVCVCDAELSNREEIVSLLQERAVLVKSTGSAELIGKLVESVGDEAFSLLCGGFSCAVWNGENLWLATDRMGMKRLSYAFAPDRSLRFGSRVAWPAGESAEISSVAAYQYLNLGFIPSPQTIYRGVRKLPAGCYLVWNRGEIRVQRYWDMKYPEDLAGSAAALGTALRSEIQKAVWSTAGSLGTEQTGCYLSGGTDSSTVLGMCARVLGVSPPAFSIGFADDRFNELSYSRIAAQHFGAGLHESIVRADDAWRSLPRLVRAFDEPFGNPSAVGAFACAEMAATHQVNVMFAGDGGDELFGGNERYRKDKVYQWLRRIPKFIHPSGLAEAFRKIAPGSSTAVRFKQILFRATLANPERFYLEDCLSANLNGNFVSAELAASVTNDEKPLYLMKDIFSGVDSHSELNRLLLLDLKFTIAENDLVKVRQTAAANGIRVRFPLLEPSLVDFSGRLPADLKLRGLQLRYLFKKALKDFLPLEIIKKKKHGFGVPVSHWFRSDPRFRELLQDVANDRVTRQRGYFQPKALQLIVAEHIRGVYDWGTLLWSILMLELWHREAQNRIGPAAHLAAIRG